MKEIRKPLKRKGGGFNIYGSEGPEYVDLLTALRDPVQIWSIDVVVQANAELAVEALELFMKYFDLFVDAQRFIDQHPIEEYFVDTGDLDVPWSFDLTRWTMDGVKPGPLHVLLLSCYCLPRPSELIWKSLDHFTIDDMCSESRR